MDKKKILSDLVDAHRQSYRRFYYPSILILIPLTLISIGGFIYCLYKYVAPIPYSYSSSYKIASYATGATASIFVVILCIGLCLRSSMNRGFEILSNETTELLVWRLEHDQWISYLEYSYGSNRTYKSLSCLPWCCRQQKFNRLKARGYGHIIFTQHSIVIDELEIIRFEKKVVLTLTELVGFSNQQMILRFHFLYLQIIEDKKTITNKHIQQATLRADIFVPNVFSQPLERLYQMVNLFNAPPSIERYLNPNFEQIRSLFE